LPGIIKIGLAGGMMAPDSSPLKIEEVKRRIPLKAEIILDAAG
jgi:hypothetical protein